MANQFQSQLGGETRLNNAVDKPVQVKGVRGFIVHVGQLDASLGRIKWDIIGHSWHSSCPIC